MSTNVSLTPALEEYIKSKVSQGFYRSVSEFVRDAVRMYRKQDIEYLQEMHRELNQAAAEIDRGEISIFDIDEITERALKELDNE